MNHSPYSNEEHSAFDPPPREFLDQKLLNEQLLLHWFGQSSYAIKNHKNNILLIDPFFPVKRPSEEFIHTRSPLDEKNFPCDAVLITHDHPDHNCVESQLRLLKKNPSLDFYAPYDAAESMTKQGIPNKNTHIIECGLSFSVKSYRIVVVYAKPPAGLPQDDIPQPDVEHLGFVIHSESKHSIYVSGDPVWTFANHASLMDPILQEKPTIGLLTTHPTEGEFPFFEGSHEIARRLKLRYAIPAHYECFVKRNYDPEEWARGFSPQEFTSPLILKYNHCRLFD